MTNMGPLKVVQMVFIRLNQGYSTIGGKNVQRRLYRAAEKDVANARRVCRQHKRQLLGSQTVVVVVQTWRGETDRHAASTCLV